VPRAGLTPERVIDEAQALSDEVGLDALTLAALAGRLGVRQPSLYKHIDGSDALRLALSVRAKRELAGVLARATVGRSGDEAIAALADAYRGWAHAHPGRYQSTVAAPAPDDAEDEAASRAVVSVVLDILAAYDLSGDDAIHATRAVRAALHGFISIEAAGGFGMPIDIDESFARLVASTTRGLAGPA
jgi:AcrR family transcriptional regulator